MIEGSLAEWSRARRVGRRPAPIVSPHDLCLRFSTKAAFFRGTGLGASPLSGGFVALPGCRGKKYGVSIFSSVIIIQNIPFVAHADVGTARNVMCWRCGFIILMESAG